MTSTSDLIDVSAIAQVLGVSRKYVADRVVHRPDFPKPAVVLSRKTRRWDRDAVEAWIRRMK